jgi:hypothetical protein
MRGRRMRLLPLLLRRGACGGGCRREFSYRYSSFFAGIPHSSPVFLILRRYSSSCTDARCSSCAVSVRAVGGSSESGLLQVGNHSYTPHYYIVLRHLISSHTPHCFIQALSHCTNLMHELAHQRCRQSLSHTLTHFALLLDPVFLNVISLGNLHRRQNQPRKVPSQKAQKHQHEQAMLEAAAGAALVIAHASHVGGAHCVGRLATNGRHRAAECEGG